MLCGSIKIIIIIIIFYLFPFLSQSNPILYIYIDRYILLEHEINFPIGHIIIVVPFVYILVRFDSCTVHVNVEDVNEFVPIFRQDSYTVTVNEGRIIDPIIQVEAFDHDCSPKYSDICKYEIVGGDKLNSPFVIDSNGNIKNTRALYYKESHNHILEVVAYDCGMKRSKPAIVNIKINKVCTLGWKGLFLAFYFYSFSFFSSFFCSFPLDH